MPVTPKRSDQRIRRNKVEPPLRVTAIGRATEPGPLDFIDEPHLLTVRWWKAAHGSMMQQFWEPTDWSAVETALWMLDRQFKSSKPSSMMVDVAYKMLADVGVTEAARRRARVEVERVSSLESVKPVGASASYRRVFGMEAG